ncbi:uncharacterized protein [Palaemon carinicauda]|uniref:uncharacterized protein n=1 Tax=Palaemon carinicauda TaxID=392227 RepID=UPI0035B5DBDD
MSDNFFLQRKLSTAKSCQIDLIPCTMISLVNAKRSFPVSKSKSLINNKELNVWLYKMSRAVIVLLSLAAIAMAQEAFLEKYSFTKTMATCFGEGVYYDYLAKIGIAQKECLQFPVSNLHRLDFSLYSQLGYPLHFGGDSLYVPFPSYHTAQQGHYGVPHGYQSLHYRKKRQAEAAGETAAAAVPQQAASPFFDRYYLLDSVNKIMAALSNYTCTLNKLNVIDEYMNININHLTEQYTSLPISDGFKQDLIDGIYYCRDLTYCLPLHNTRSPLPLNLQRLLMAMECEKETRTNACFKEDLRKNVGEFDLSLFPEDDDQESVLNKLSAIITGVDSLNELEIL